jgi:hypothetical protein
VVVVGRRRRRRRRRRSSGSRRSRWGVAEEEGQHRAVSGVPLYGCCMWMGCML